MEDMDIGMKIATFSGIENNQLFDAFMEHYNMMVINMGRCFIFILLKIMNILI